jgi:hypothetical protein
VALLAHDKYRRFFVIRLVPVTLRDAKAFTARHHRHNAPPVGHKFSIGAAVDDTLVAVVIVGRPVGRGFDNGDTLEVTRLTTDGTPHAASMLYAAAWRAAKALGYRRLVTYTQADERGTSLKAAGWRVIAERPARASWSVPSRPRTEGRYDVMVPRTLWEAS